MCKQPQPDSSQTSSDHRRHNNRGSQHPESVPIASDEVLAAYDRGFKFDDLTLNTWVLSSFSLLLRVSLKRVYRRHLGLSDDIVGSIWWLIAFLFFLLHDYQIDMATTEVPAEVNHRQLVYKILMSLHEVDEIRVTSALNRFKRHIQEEAIYVIMF